MGSSGHIGDNPVAAAAADILRVTGYNVIAIQRFPEIAIYLGGMFRRADFSASACLPLA